MSNKLEELELRSEEVQEILTKVPHWMIRWGSVLFLVLMLMLILITWVIKYPDIISSTVLITTQNPPQKEYTKINGKLSAILVNDYDQVTVDQALAVIENTSNYKDVFKLKSIIDTISIRVNSFSFPMDRMPILFLGEIESQYAVFENSYIQYQLNKKLKPFSNEAIANEFSISVLNRRLNNLKSQKSISETELEFKRKDLERYKALFLKGVISAQEYENKQLEFVRVERYNKDFNGSISQLRLLISNANKKSRGSKITETKEEVRLLKNVKQSFNQLKKAIKDWEHLYVLKSNIRGVISFMGYWNVNQNVNSGDLLFTIVPSESSALVAKLKASPLNSGKIKHGQKVIIKLENYPETEFGTLNGIVNTISLTPDNDGLYYIVANLPQKLLTSYKKEIEFRYEMNGKAEIITEDLRIIERFFYQFRELFNR